MQRKLDVRKIGDYFKKVREDYGYTIDDFSQMLCVSRKTLLLVEKGKKMPSLLMVVRCSNEFDISADNFVIYEE